MFQQWLCLAVLIWLADRKENSQDNFQENVSHGKISAKLNETIQNIIILEVEFLLTCSEPDLSEKSCQLWHRMMKLCVNHREIVSPVLLKSWLIPYEGQRNYNSMSPLLHDCLFKIVVDFSYKFDFVLLSFLFLGCKLLNVMYLCSRQQGQKTSPVLWLKTT